jgi:hypothetical protein
MSVILIPFPARTKSLRAGLLDLEIIQQQAQ